MEKKYDSEYLETSQLAMMLNVSKKAIIKWREQGRLAGAVRCGRVWRFNRLAIEKRLLSGKLLLDKG